MSQHYEFKNITGKNGLVGSNVFCSIQDEKGYMWFTTEKAVCRFDGTNFKIFGNDEGYNEAGAYYIYKDKRNRLWVISFNFKLFYFDGQKFKQFKGIKNACWITEDDLGCLWVGTRESVFYKIDRDKIVDTVIDRISLGKVSYNFIVKNPDLIISTSVWNIIEIKQAKSHILPISAHHEYNMVSRLFMMRNKVILISNHEGIYARGPLDKSFRFIYPSSKNEVICFFEDTVTNDIWIGTHNGALRFKNGIIHRNNAEKYFPNAIIHSITKDREGFYWFCTDNSGIYYGNLIASHINTTDGILSNDIRFIQNSNDGIYFVTTHGRFNLLSHNRLRPFHQGIPSVEFRHLIYMFKTTDQKIYFRATSKSKLYSLWNKKFSEITHPANRTYLPFSKQSSLYYTETELVREQGRKKICTTGSLEKLIGYPEHMSSSILNFGDSVFYFTVERGYVKMTIRNGRQYFYKEPDLPYTITQIDITEKGTIILQTKQNGIILIKNNKYDYVNTTNGLVNDYCNKIFYNHHKIWVCTDNGLSKIILDANDDVTRIENYTSGNFLIDDEVRDVLEYKSKIYVATSGGLSFFDEREVEKNTRIYPEVYIRNISVNNRDTNTFLNHYELPYNENNISISYAFIGSAGNLFKYKLEGTDQAFNYTPHTTIRFANLSPGEYRFVVYARNNFGTWSIQPAYVELTILRPYWKAWWFISLTGCAIIVLTGYFIFLKIGSIHKKDRFRHQLVQSELRALRLYINPHFIFNSLNSLHMFILKNNMTEAGAYIIDFSRVIRSIMKYSSRSFITIEEETELLNTYILLEKKRFTNSFEFSIVIDPLIDTHNTHIPPLIIQPFVENAIKHGLSGKNRDGKLVITFSLEGKFICCIISDNGIGRETVKKKQLSNNHTEESTGIRYIEERLKLLAPRKDINPVEIIDLYDDGKACGTKVQLLIPIL